MTKIVNIKNKEQLEDIKKSKFSCLFVKANGCHHCEQAQPLVEKMSKLKTEVEFFQLEINEFPEVMEFYKQYAELEHRHEVEFNDDGQPITDDQGHFKVKYFFNPDGSPEMVSKVAIPTFLMFYSDEQDEDDNKYGFIGKISGNLTDKLESVLEFYLDRFNITPKPKYNVLKGGLKSLTRIAKNKLTGVDDKVPTEVAEARYLTCMGCPKFNKVTTQCSVCKCFLKVKTTYKEESCPEGKWGQYAEHL